MFRRFRRLGNKKKKQESADEFERGPVESVPGKAVNTRIELGHALFLLGREGIITLDEAVRITEYCFDELLDIERRATLCEGGNSLC